VTGATKKELENRNTILVISGSRHHKLRSYERPNDFARTFNIRPVGPVFKHSPAALPDLQHPPYIIKIGHYYTFIIYAFPPDWNDLAPSKRFPLMKVTEFQERYYMEPRLNQLFMLKICPMCGYHRMIRKDWCATCGQINPNSTLVPLLSNAGSDARSYID